MQRCIFLQRWSSYLTAQLPAFSESRSALLRLISMRNERSQSPEKNQCPALVSCAAWSATCSVTGHVPEFSPERDGILEPVASRFGQASTNAAVGENASTFLRVEVAGFLVKRVH